MIDLSIAIVAYNDEENVRDAVCSILEHTAKTISKKVYIIDNSDRENRLRELAEQEPEVFYLKTRENKGFGAGHNEVLGKLDSKYHAIVNPDILLVEDSFGKLLEFMEDSTIGMAVPRIVDEDGSMQESYRKEPTVLDMVIRSTNLMKKRQREHVLADRDFSKAFQVPFAHGCFYLIRTELFEKLGGFDERYFLYMEDADLCKQVNQCSRLVYCPDTKVIHKWDRGSKKRADLKKIHIQSMISYFKKWGWKLW
ncbi:MAG: glycosyltransferase family 2 protein [Lachnospiraceae bacterium]|nr:glycosyltransferase family 2 protein [Lachnospiraceae bacterium]